jgi:hypothetical protein
VSGEAEESRLEVLGHTDHSEAHKQAEEAPPPSVANYYSGQVYGEGRRLVEA